jgi:ABC-2 type transport system permease protein
MSLTLATTSRRSMRPDTVPFTRLLRIEWRKSGDTRAARWMLAVIALLTAGATAVPLLLPRQFEQAWPAYLAPAGLVLALLLPVVSILTLTSEWGQRSVLVTFTQEPRRVRVVAAKVLSGTGLSLLGSAYAVAVTAAALGLSDALGRQVTWHLPARYLAGFVVFVLLNSLMGMAFGALLLNTPAAIVLFFVLPTAWSLLSYGWLKQVGEWLDTAQTFNYVLQADWHGHTGPILVSIGFWIAMPLGLGAIRTVRREVS